MEKILVQISIELREWKKASILCPKNIIHRVVSNIRIAAAISQKKKKCRLAYAIETPAKL